MKKHNPPRFRMHDPETGFLYFTAGAAQWQPLHDGSRRWLLRVDVVFQSPMTWTVPDASTAEAAAIELARDFEAHASSELVALDISASGRVLYGSPAQARSPTSLQHERAQCDSDRDPQHGRLE